MKNILKITMPVLFLGNIAFADPFPSNQLVGYQENLNYQGEDYKKTAMFNEVMEHGYDVLFIAFGQVDGNNQVKWFDNGWNNQGYAPYQNQEAFLLAIDEYHKQGGLAFVAFGSDNKELWQPNDQEPKKLAENIIQFMIEHKLDGIDFDLEAGQNATTAFMEELIKYLRQFADVNRSHFPNGFYISAAPTYNRQINQLNWAGAYGNFPELAKKIIHNSPAFDMIFVQNYNDPYALDSGELFEKLLSQGYPKETKFVIGKPAVEKAANSGGYVTPEKLNESLQMYKNNPQYGGIGVWTVAHDKENNWAFSSGLKS